MRVLHPIRTWRSLRRRSKVITGIVSGLVLVPLVAFAAGFFFHVGVGGSVKSGEFQYVVSGPAVAGGSGHADVCASVASNANATGFNITAGSGGMPGDECDITFAIQGASNTSTGFVNGVEFGTNGSDLPTGWTASVSPCGPGTVIDGASQQMQLTITVGNNAKLDGSTHTFGATDSIDVAPTSEAASLTQTCSVTGP